MEDINSIVLPHILETLSQKPDLCDTFDNLYDEMKAHLATVNPDTRTGNVRSALKKALNIGQSLGIITMADEIIRVPFSFRTDGKSIRAPVRMLANDKFDDDEDEEENVPRRSSGRKSVQPRKRDHLDQNESGFVMVSPRKRHPGISEAPADLSGRRRSQVRRRHSIGRARARGNRSRSRRSTKRRM